MRTILITENVDGAVIGKLWTTITYTTNEMVLGYINAKPAFKLKKRLIDLKNVK
jgi:hypothetical protein